jgi:hypothetical protein
MSSLKISITDLFFKFGYNEVKVFVCVLAVERILGRMIHGVKYTAYGFDDDKFKYGLSLENGWSIKK